MPTTYNGIGTHYYGKKNITKRPGPCPHCNRAVELTSYDTRLWFVIVFIPIIPVGRKRIIDYCPSCTRHYAVDKQKWETAKQLEISGAMEQYRANPTPEGAIGVHQQLLKFHQAEQAAEFQKTMSEKYGDNAKVQSYLGAALEHVGKTEEAAAYFQRALALRPDLPEARIGAARGNVRAGRLDEARKLLDFLEKPGASQLYSLHPLETLGLAYQKAGSHQEALDLFAKLQAELPKIGEVKGFRDMVKKSEKALDRKDSMLPKQKFSWRRFFTLPSGAAGRAGAQSGARALIILGIILGLVALGFVIANEFSRRHRTIYILNAWPQPVTVKLSGGMEARNVRHTQQLQVTEGRYHATITGAVRQELDLEVRSGYFSRWTDDPLWVLNIGGAGVLVYEEVSYGRNTAPAAISFHFGEPFEFFPNVTHPFKDLPESIRMKESETRVLTHLDLVKDGEAVYEYLKKEGKAGEALRLAETYLRAHPGDVSMFNNYATDASRQKQTDRLDQYLKTGLTNRPIRIEWHRWHQRLHQNPRDQAQLIADYSAMVEADPTNSALLYLRGRIDPDRAASRQLFQRAATADPSNAYAFFALGYDRMAAGDWPAARKQLARAVELSPGDPGFSSTLFEVRLALGETAEIEKETREQLKQKPLDFTAELQLIHTLVAQGRREDALKEVAAYEKRWPAKYAASGRNAITTLRRQTLYAIGDFAELEKSAVSDSSRPGRQILAEAFIEQGRVSEAVKLRTETDSLEEKPFWLLSLAVAFHHAGDTNAAAEWRGKAIEAMAAGNEDYAQAAKMMSAAVPPAATDLEAIVLAPSAKALFLSALAQKHPSAATEFAAAARHFNIERSFPYHLVERVTADRRGPAERP